MTRPHSARVAARWNPESRVTVVLGLVADAITHASWIAREAPHAAQAADRARLLLEQAEQVLGRDVTRELSLPSYRTASAGGTVDVRKYRPENGYLSMVVRRSTPSGTVPEVSAAADAFRRDVSGLLDALPFVGPERHVGDVTLAGWQRGLLLEVYVRVEGPPFEDADFAAAIKRSGFRFAR